jgi:hypothetical protein
MVTAVMAGNGTQKVTLTPYWWGDALGSAIAHLTGTAPNYTPSGSQGSGPAVAGPTAAFPNIQLEEADWSAVTLGAPTGGWAGKALYCALFQKLDAGASVTGHVIDVDVRVRFVG